MSLTTSGIIGSGAKLSYSADDVTYTDLTGLTDLPFPDSKVGEAKNTALDTASYAQAFLPGLIDGGDLKFKMRFNGTLFATLYGFFTGRATKYWKITWPDGTVGGSTLKFSGFINGVSGVTPIEELVEADFSIKVTGVPSFTAGT